MDELNPISEVARKNIYTELANIALDGLEKGTIPIDSQRDLANFILSKMDAVSNYGELLAFLEELSVLYPVFGPYLAQIKSEKIKAQDTADINKISEEIKNIGGQDA